MRTRQRGVIMRSLLPVLACVGPVVAVRAQAPAVVAAPAAAATVAPAPVARVAPVASDRRGPAPAAATHDTPLDGTDVRPQDIAAALASVLASGLAAIHTNVNDDHMPSGADIAARATGMPRLTGTPGSGASDIAMDAAANARYRTLEAASHRGSSGASGSSTNPQALSNLAQQLEGVFANEMLKAMRATVPEGAASGGAGENIFTSLMDERIAGDMTKQWRRDGIQQALVTQLGGGATRRPSANHTDAPRVLRQPTRPTASPDTTARGRVLPASPSTP